MSGIIKYWLFTSAAIFFSFITLARHAVELNSKWRASSSVQHVRFLQLSALVHLFLFLGACPFLLLQVYYSEATGPNALSQTFSIVKVLLMFVAGGVNLAVGLNRLALFERLMNRHMKALVRTLQFATPVLVGLYTITAICRMILVSAGPDVMAYFDIITTISIALFGITVFFHVFTDMSIVYFVLQKKFGMQRNDEDFLKEVKITVGILMVNIVVLFAAVILDTMHFSTKVAMGTVECMLQIYFIGNIYCLRKVKKIGTKSTGSSFESRMKRSLSQKKPSIAPEGSVTTQHTRGSCDLGTSDGRRQKKYSIAAESINSGPRETCELGSSDAKKQLENCKDSSHC